MSSTSRLDSYFEYGRTLLDSGAKGIRSGSESYLHGQPLTAVLGESARASLPFAALGIGAGLLQLISGSRRHRFTKGLAAAIAGGSLGFLAGLLWKSRDLTGCMAQDALENISRTRDAHWLERHPIDYA